MISVIFIQPADYEAFLCIGAACEDTCCEGWRISVDKATYKKFQDNPGRKLGEGYLGHAYASYPRIVNTFEGRRERSLGLSWPEARRIALLDPLPMQFSLEFTTEGSAARVRKLLLHLLQDRRYPISKRLMLVGDVCRTWSELDGTHAPEQARIVFLEHFARAIHNNWYGEDPQRHTANPASQLAITLELLTARIRLDYSPIRYLKWYREFVEGLQTDTETNLDASAMSH